MPLSNVVTERHTLKKTQAETFGYLTFLLFCLRVLIERFEVLNEGVKIRHCSEQYTIYSLVF